MGSQTNGVKTNENEWGQACEIAILLELGWTFVCRLFDMDTLPLDSGTCQ